MNLDTRLVQLDATIHMELWQEAYKAVEDIHGLMSLSKKVFQPKMMVNYYQNWPWSSGSPATSCSTPPRCSSTSS